MWVVLKANPHDQDEVVGMAVEEYEAEIIAKSFKGETVWLQECPVTDDRGSTDTVVVVQGVTDEERRAGNYKFMPHMPDLLMSNEDLVKFHLANAVGVRLNELVSHMKWVEGNIGKDPNLNNEHRHPSVLRPVEGSQDCPKSPTKVCWYDDLQDTAWDFCLFCGEPHERK